MRRRTRWLVICALAAVGALWALGGNPGSGAVSKANTDPDRPVAAAKNLQQAWSSLEGSPAGCSKKKDTRCLAALRQAVSQKPSADPKLTWELNQLADAAAQAGAAGRSINAASVDLLPKSLRDMVRARLMRLDDAGRVHVFLQTTGSANEVAAGLGSGVTVERVADDQRIVQAWVPASQIRTLSAQPDITQVRLPDYGVVQAGSVTTEGDALLHAANVRSTFGIDGSGVRVGVISDGVEGLAASQGSGDLPTVNTTTCNVAGTNPTASGAGAEGTAMLEIVHDLVPGAELWFGYWGNGTYLDFNAAVNCLAQNVDVVVDDVGWYNVGPYDGTSAVSANTSAALNNPSNRIRGYYNAVGNQALRHYQEPFVNDGFGNQVFQATTSTLDQGAFGTRSDNPTIVPANAVASVLLEWNDPFGSSCNNYDMRAWLHNTATLVGSSTSPQSCSQNPTEFIALDNTGGPDTLVDITISKVSGAARTFDMFFIDAYPYYLTPCSSVPNNSDAGGGVVALGAIGASDPGTSHIESFSSCGPTNDGRTKPDAAAVDGVCVTAAGGFASGNPACQTVGRRFFGTSAAAPHAAGIAALLLQCNPSLTRTQLHDALLNTAVDLGSPGTDNVYGHGRIDAVAAANAAGCTAGGSSTPTATRTHTPIPTQTAGSAATGTPTRTPIPPSDTPTPTHAPSDTPSPTPTATPTDTPTPTSTATRTPTPTPVRQYGDANCDHTVSSIDSALVLQLVAGLINALPCHDNADVNGDGRVDSVDSLLILQFVAGLLHSLPATS